MHKIIKRKHLTYGFCFAKINAIKKFAMGKGHALCRSANRTTIALNKKNRNLFFLSGGI